MDKVIHINATPEFHKDEKAVKQLEKMVELAYNIDSKKQICYKLAQPCPYDCQGLCRESY